MRTLISPPTGPLALPPPRVPVTIRPAVAGDLRFVDQLQKLHTNAVGWMPTKQLEGKIAAGHVLVAEGAGYCIARDQYFKRDDLGIVYQMNVAPAKQRGLVGAALLKAVFDRAAYGCRLFCCWCAQDIEANYFWESMGFVPLAFRAGSREKGRVHIFWQRRIHAGDTTTPWWFPSQTTSGSIREDRLVLPIPPGTHWSEVKPILLPGAVDATGKGSARQLPDRRKRSRSEPAKEAVVKNPAAIMNGGLRFVVPAPPTPAKPKREPKPKVKHDPRHVAAARELRDRYLEHINADPSAVLSGGKYDVSRLLTPAEAEPAQRMLVA